MDITGWVWGLTVVGLVGLVVFDYVFHVRRPHVPTL
jgi:tellurite resistance protein TerC